MILQPVRLVDKQKPSKITVNYGTVLVNKEQDLFLEESKG